VFVEIAKHALLDPLMQAVRVHPTLTLYAVHVQHALLDQHMPNPHVLSFPMQYAHHVLLLAQQEITRQLLALV